MVRSLAAVVVLVLGLLGPPGAASAAEPTGTLTGELSILIEDPPAGGEPVVHVALETEGGMVPLDVALPTGAEPGAPAVVELTDPGAVDDALTGRRDEPLAVESIDVGRAPQALASPTTHRAYVAYGPGVTATQAQQAATRAAGYWAVEGGPAVPSFTVASVQAYGGPCSTGAATSTWNTADDLFPGVSFGPGSGNHLIVLGSCDGTGLGTLGGAMADGGKVIATYDAFIIDHTLAHEVGHNVGLEHAGSPTGGSYGNYFSVMGSAWTVNSVGFGPTALDSAYRAQLDIATAGELTTLRAGGSSQTVVLQPRAAASGTRGIGFTAADGDRYWIEYRSGTGRDDATFYDRSFTFISPVFTPGVVITRTGAGGTLELVPDGGAAAWAAGRTFASADLTVTVDAVGSTATVRVANAAVVGGSTVPDTTAPTVAVTGGPVEIGRGLTAPTWFTASDAGGVAAQQCRVDAGAWAPCTSPYGVATTALGLGDHVIEIRATDGAGNVGTASRPLRVLRFADVASGHAFFGEIDWLAGAGVTSGYAEVDGSSTYRGSQPVLREQMAAFLYRFTGATATSTTCAFSDLAAFRKEICWLASTGITTGYDDGTFRGSQPVLREQMAAFLYRLAGRPAVALPATSPFTDVQPTDTFYREIVWLASTGITTGYDVGGGRKEFRGSENVLREQMAAFLSRYDVRLGRG